MPLLDPALKEILVCPNCRGELEELETESKLRCTRCGLAYPVRDGIPVMLIDEAEKPAGFQPQQDASSSSSGEA
jgi:uncharacterized protein YbaR (Trm112 family)